MGIIANSNWAKNTTTTNNSNRDMGFLLFFFSSHKNSSAGLQDSRFRRQTDATQSLPKLNSPSPAYSLLVLFSFLLFALSTFEPPPLPTRLVPHQFLSKNHLAGRGRRSGFETIVREENDLFSALLRLHCATNHCKSPLKERGKCSWSRFDAERFVKRVNHSKGMVKAAAAGTMEPTLLLGKKFRINASINGSYNPAPSSDG
ncbi:unnamed protein product [Linum trigynum]|uniref:Uncharacterized protein n=1 Tax=Linum trigynum TaxID=586398 RepID=A0AAV2FQW7_9ROSI